MSDAQNQRTLVDALQEEMRRVRDDVMPAYLALPPASHWFAVGQMRAALDHATKALAEQDGVECLRAYEQLKGFST